MEDRSYVETNLRALERLRDLVAGSNDDSLTAPVNEYWSVAGVLAHMAWWDARVVVFAEKIDRVEPWVPTDEEPEGDWLNDTTRLVIEGLAPHAPRASAELALRMAEQADARVAELPLDRMAPRDPSSPIHPDRADHRVEHLDEIEAVLARRER